MRDTTFFHFSKLFFIQNYRFLYHGDQKISWWTSCRWRAVNFKIHLWSSGRNADCIWRSISIQHVQIEAGLNSDPGNDSFWDKIRDAEHVIDLLIIVHVDRRRWRSYQLTSDLKRCLLFRKCLRWSSRKAASVPSSVIGGLGATATSDLVRGWACRCRLVGSCVLPVEDFFT